MSELKIKRLKKDPEFESIRINRSAGKAAATLRFIKFRDKDTRQIVIYIPSFEISGYGATDKKANEMVKFSVKEYLEFLLQLPQDRRDTELRKLGWKPEKLRHKEYSKAYIDVDGNLKQFNAVDNQIEEGILTL